MTISIYFSPRILRSGLFTALALLIIPAGLSAQVCPYGNGGGSGSGAGGATLVSIVVDGSAADWGPVLANAGQVTLDGEMCVAGTTDRDCAVPSGGRDLDTFAWTYDATSVYLYMKRYGSVANQQTFYFFMDTNANQRMNSGEKVLAVDYKGSNRNTIATLYTYTAAGGAAGDAMADPITGYADGYAIAGGAIGGAIVIYSGIIGGFADGSGFEAYVPWSDMGVPAGTPIYFHVSSSNGSSGGLIDNLGGPDGRIGAFAFRSVSVTPDYSSAVTPGDPTVVEDDKTVANTGTLPDRYDLTVFSTLGLRVDLYDGVTLMATDADGDGDFSDPGDYVNTAYDSNADGRPDTSLLDAAGTFDVTVRITAPAGVVNVQDVTTLSAFSHEAPDLCASAGSTTAIGDLTLTPTPQAKSVVAGQTVVYGLTLGNYSLGDTLDLRVLSSLGWQVQIFTDPNGDGDPADGTLAATDTNGDGDYLDAGDSITSGFDSNANSRPDFGVVPNSQTRAFVVRLTAPAGAAIGTVDTCTVLAQGASFGASATASLSTTVRLRLSFTPDYSVVLGANKYSGQGKSVFYGHTLINAWPAADTIALSAASNPAGWTITFWTDPDGNGNPGDGVAITAPFVLSGNGGTLRLVVEVVIPMGLTLPLTHSAVVSATGTGDAPTVTDDVRVSYVAAYQDANHTLSQRDFALCQTIYAMGSSLAPSSSYTFRYLNPSSTVIRSQGVASDSNGDAFDQYTLAAADERGTWTLELRNASNILVDSLTVFVDPPTGDPSTVSPLTTGRASYALSGNNLSITATYNNTSTGADYVNTTYRYLVRSPDLSQYLRSDGAFAAYTGSELTRSTAPHTVPASSSRTETVTVNGVVFPSAGIYRIDATWLGSCGSTIATDTLVIPVGTTLGSYADGASTTPMEFFGAGATVHLSGAHYLPATAYTVAYYRSDGTLALTQSATSTSGGALADGALVSSLAAEGAWHAVVYRSTFTPPPVFNAADPWAASQDAFIVDTVAPAVAVSQASTVETSPELSGTVDDPTAAVQVTVNGNAYPAVNNGDGSWTLPAGTIAPGLTPGFYDVSAVATDAAGNAAADATTDELIVKYQAPVLGGPIGAGPASISGLSSAPDGTTVTIYSDGKVLGTLTVAGGVWSYSGAELSALAGGESITATVGTGLLVSAMSNAVLVTPAAPVFTSLLVTGGTLVTGTSTAPPGSTITVYVDGTAYTTTVLGDGTWGVTVPPLAAGETVTATATAGMAVSAPATGGTISAIPNLLRDDSVASLAAYDPALVFTLYPGDPSLDGFGPNALAQIGEGALQEANGSSDDDDFYHYEVPNGYLDPDPTVLTDANRPLVFYQLSCPTGSCTLFLTKDSGSVKITYTLP